MLYKPITMDDMFLTKECVAVLTMLYRKNGAVLCVGCVFSLTGLFTLPEQNLQTAYTMECRMVVVIHGYPIGLDLVMGKNHAIETATHSYFLN